MKMISDIAKLSVTVLSTAIILLSSLQTYYNIKIMREHEKLLSSNAYHSQRRSSLGIVVITPCAVKYMRRVDLEKFVSSLRYLSGSRIVERIFVVVDDENDIDLFRRIARDLVNNNIVTRISDEKICQECSGKNRAILTILRDLYKEHEEDKIVLVMDCDAEFLGIDEKLYGVSGVLNDLGNAIVTSYRWYTIRDTCSLMYNLVSSMFFEVLLSNKTRIVWGGFMGFSKNKSLIYGVPEELSREIADDATIRRVFTRYSAQIIFCPQCIGFSSVECSSSWFREFVSWATRQLLMIRIYTPRGFRIVFAGYFLLFSLNIAPLAMALVSVEISLLALVSLFVPMLLVGLVKNLALVAYLSRLHPRSHVYESILWLVAYLFLASLRSLFVAPLLVKTILTRELIWRGKRYCIYKQRQGLKMLMC